MCSGRVDPVLIMESFAAGADGVMVGACLKGECHYSIGNLQAEGKIEVVKRVLHRLGIDPRRLSLKMMSSAQGARFRDFAEKFQGEIRGLGPLGSGEKIDKQELKLRIEAGRRALAGKKLRWVEGKWLEFQEQGNVYGETFTLHELGRMYEEIALDECALRELMLRLDERTLSAKELAQEMRMPAYRVLRHLSDLHRMDLVSLKEAGAGDPVWTACGSMESDAESIEQAQRGVVSAE